MSEQPGPERRAARVRATARAFPYPPTPDLAGRVRRGLAAGGRADRPGRPRARLVGLGLTVLLLLLGSALGAVPEVQALARALLRVGAVQIVVATPAPLPTPPPTGAPTRAPSPTAAAPLPLVGATTLGAAQARVSFPLKLPAYPPALGRPDRVFVQDLGGPAVILVWLVPGHPDQVKMSLSFLTSATVARKTVDGQTILQETRVRGAPALWLRGPHILQYYGPDGQIEFGPRQLVGGSVLIWQEGAITYRLEAQTQVPLPEAVRIAESLR